jgi:hypothetical protein
MYEPGHNYYERLQRSGNVLILKSDVGKAKPCAVPLPPPSFVYGQGRVRDKEGVGSIISSWETHAVSKLPEAPRDFKTLNVMGLRNGLWTSKELTQFRKVTDAKVKIREGRAYAGFKIPDETFGVKVRPSTPMVSVLGNEFGKAAYDERHEKYSMSQSFSKLPEVQVSHLSSVPTKAQKDLNHSTFKMRKFLSTAPRTNTHLRPKGTRSVTSLDLSHVVRDSG